MRIAFFIEVFYPEINGVITATLDLARNMHSRGHHVLLVVPNNPKAEKVREVDGMEVYPVPSFSTFLYPGVRFSSPWDRGLLEKLEKDRIRILHITGPWTLAWAAINHGKKLSLPLVHTFHTMLNEDTYILYLVKYRKLIPLGRKISWWYLSKYIKASDVITAPSRFACEELEKRFPDKPVHHISNGVKREQFLNFAGRKEFMDNYPFFNDKTFIFVGRIGLEKSIDILIRAFSLAVRRDGELRLVLVGDGPNKTDMENLAREMGAEKNIYFLGKIRHDLLISSGLLQYARAFLTASVTENQPMTVIEAICCGLPIIVADVEAMRELSDENALMFSPGDAEDLGNKIFALGRDDALKVRLSRGSKNYSQSFDGAFVAEQFELLYRDLYGEMEN
jgi:glycosyltransferase involved in cell wall biosynthesis